MTDSTVTLGDVEFDPVEIQDFRLSVEGTSSTGKSNTLAVILEDLAGVSIPTLVVERLGALAPVRLEDDDIVVVGAREEEGIDLAVALDDLDMIGEWVLDRGMKVLLDISTYADYEDERSRVHHAAARAIRSLNERAHERYRAGDRTKSLLVVDEAHILAPKDSAPEPQMDEWVKACRGQIISASTEGGNKGISSIVAYQRRAFLHNGVIQLCDDFVAHKPGQEDISRTADALHCDEETLANLDTGEILARGQEITGGSLVGPTKVRKRRSPDPREETFELPETPDELADVLDEIQSDVEAERERREQRQSELERLREEVEDLREDKDELRQELRDQDRLARALENAQSAPSGEAPAGLAEEIDELEARKNELADRVEELEAENDHLAAERDRLETELDDLREQYENDMAALNSLRTGFQMLGLGGDGETIVEGVTEDSAREIARDVVSSMDLGGGGPSRTIEDVHDVILADFQEEAVESLMADVDGMSEQQRELLAFIEAKGSRVQSRKQWARDAFAIESPGQEYYEPMNDLADRGFVRLDDNSRVYPNTRSLVEDKLDGYDVDEGTVGETYEEILARLGREVVEA